MSISINVLPWLTAILFIVGAFLFWRTFFSQFKFNRTNRLALFLERAERKIKRPKPEDSILNSVTKTVPYKERLYLERARLSGLSPDWTRNKFIVIQLTISIPLAVVSIMMTITDPIMIKLISPTDWVIVGIRTIIIASIGYWLPMWIIMAAAKSQKAKWLMEIALFAERLSLCVSDKADIREMISRASRPLNLLKPHITELVEKWQVDQKKAIWGFQASVGITEIFPLVNALDNISKAKSTDIVHVLKDQTASIEAALEADVKKQIENAPIVISFLVLIPFLITLILLLYPWVTQASKLISTSI
ncbi:hypothetical protein B1A99_25095 [Cohnella sp. CIP 111063]|uniref:hypothetical protein n=1 Tax=unclassified Cohnella TaxID=2636738 RepID=UPI000B8C0F9B|nr:MULTISPECIES: hypothetical protein [unclassified Cohnella]OXS55058.1 hypothetical protein B1A99_25095 [Cohnella sp. CIP 111063]PRX65193.1 hypothetical protein B0G52_118146 [Cohnella sp. SGD-V74]